MKKVLYLTSIVIALLMLRCHDDDSENISWSQDASALVKDGISLTHDKAEMIMNFTAMSSDVSVTSDESWIDASVSLVEGKGELKVST